MSPLILDFGKGAVLGFSIAAPVGPIGLLCIQRTLAHGFWAGASAGLGTAVADAFYAAIAAFGLTAVTVFLTSAQTPIRVVGIALMLWLAWKAWTQGRTLREGVIANGSSWKTFAQTFALTLTNPATILSFLALFVGFGVGTGASAVQAGALVSGTFLGSMLWWMILSGFISGVRHKLSPRALRWINRGAALILLAFAVWFASDLVRVSRAP